MSEDGLRIENKPSEGNVKWKGISSYKVNVEGDNPVVSRALGYESHVAGGDIPGKMEVVRTELKDALIKVGEVSNELEADGVVKGISDRGLNGEPNQEDHKPGFMQRTAKKLRSTRAGKAVSALIVALPLVGGAKEAPAQDLGRDLGRAAIGIGTSLFRDVIGAGVQANQSGLRNEGYATQREQLEALSASKNAKLRTLRFKRELNNLTLQHNAASDKARLTALRTGRDVHFDEGAWELRREKMKGQYLRDMEAQQITTEIRQEASEIRRQNQQIQTEINTQNRVTRAKGNAISRGIGAIGNALIRGISR